MACKDLHGVINDRPVYVRQWPASTAIENLGEALSLFGNQLAFFIDGSYQFGDILTVMHRNDPKALTAVIKKFVIAANVDGKSVQETMFNAEYNGDLYRVFRTFAFVCEVNYRDFFAEGAPPPEPGQSEEPEQEDQLEKKLTP